MADLSERIIDKLESNDFYVCSNDQQDGEFVAEVEFYSPAGEDVIMVIWHDGTEQGFIDSFDKYARDFDVDEHVELWIDSRGKNGVPGTLRELLNDAEQIRDISVTMAVSLKSLLSEIPA